LGYENAHQISIGSVKRFISHSDLKKLLKSKMTAELDFSKILEMEIIALGGMKTPTKLQLDLSTGLKLGHLNFFYPRSIA
jgi:hypothetical protein